MTFGIGSLLTTQSSLPKGVCKIAIERKQSQACLSYAKREQFGRSQRREAQRANSRGFSNPWNNDKIKIWRLQRRERAVRVAVPRLYRRHYYVAIKNRGLESPRLFIFPSFRRIFSHYSLLKAHRSKLYTPLHRGRGWGEGPGGSTSTPPILLHHHRPRPCLEWDRA